jgi:tetratricopeptide (TPR) repeat protein
MKLRSRRNLSTTRNAFTVAFALLVAGTARALTPMQTPAYVRWGISQSGHDARSESLLVQAHDTLYAQEFAKAETLYRRVLETWPNSAEAHLGLALAYRYLYDDSASLWESRRALELDSLIPAANVNYAEKLWPWSGPSDQQLGGKLSQPERCSLALFYARRAPRSSHATATYAFLSLWVFNIGLERISDARCALDSLLARGFEPPFLLEFGRDALASVEPAATVFANGDNDTYPLLVAQLAYGVNPDASIVNVSMLNAAPFAKCYKHHFGVPISYSDAEIDSITASQHKRGTKYVTASTILTENIITNSLRANRPVYFMSTVAQENRAGCDDSLISEGLVYRVANHKVRKDSMNLPRAVDNMLNKCRLANVNAETNWPANWSPVTRDLSGMRGNYAIAFLEIARQCERVHDTADGLRACERALQVNMDRQKQSQFRYLVSHLFSKFGRTAEAQVLLDSAVALSGKDPETDPTTQLQVKWSQALNLRAEGKYAASESLYRTLVLKAPGFYWELFDLYLNGMKNRKKAVKTLRTWFQVAGPNWDNLCRLVDAYKTRLGDRKSARQAIDDWVRKHPQDAERARQLKEGL